MNTIPRMDEALMCRLMNVRIIGSGRLPKEDLQTIDDAIDALRKLPVQPNLLSWAVDRWFAEVSNRPLVNKNRRTLDDTWRQVIRFACGNPDELIGPSHDDLLAGVQPKPANQQKE